MAIADANSETAATQPALSLSEWVDRHSGRIMLLPAVLIMLAFALFPLIISAYLSVARFVLAPGGFRLTFVGLSNFKKLLVSVQQYHFLGTFGAFGPFAWTIGGLAVLSLLYWIVRFVLSPEFTLFGLLGRLVSATFVTALVLLTLATLIGGGLPGSLMTTLVYVVVGVSVQFALGLGLALLCAQPIRCRSLYRVVFFVPLMVTPVGTAYTFRALADMEKGPLAPIRFAFHLGEFAWATDPWLARLVVLLGDTWQWTPFMFIVLLAAIENQPRDQVEAALIDGANPLQIFRDITWAGIAPVAATVVLIRLIEAFKIIDLPNVLTSGGPGLATESVTLHAFIAWRTQDLGGSAAIGYMLLFVSTVTCISFFNYGVRRARRYQA
jgi:multiple sugar transport system permease protein